MYFNKDLCFRSAEELFFAMGHEFVHVSQFAYLGSIKYPVSEYRMFGLGKIMDHWAYNYEDYLRVRGLEQWNYNCDKATQTRKICSKHNESEFYRNAILTRNDETIANIAITLIHQEDVFLRKLLDSLQVSFVEDGGIREQMSKARIEHHKNNKE